MSAFLGPIHYWLYNKIEIQEQLVQKILKWNEKKGYVQQLKQLTKEECGQLEQKPLEDIIDEKNIHGWLQERVSIVEKRLAFTVTAIVKEDAKRMEEIIFLAKEAGREARIKMNVTTFSSANEVYQLIHNVLLEGMPCDHINEVIEETKDRLTYRQTRCIHESYWLLYGGLVMNFYDIRRGFLNGLLEETSFELEEEEFGKFTIRRI